MAVMNVDRSRLRVADLDDRDLARLWAALMAGRAAQVALVAEHDATMIELTGQGDVDSILERELAEAAASRARETIDDIEGALARMEAGSYGFCDSCREPIPIERLDAIPHVRFCVSCPGDRSGFVR
jgi:DnaK suppressor protein